MWTLARVAEVIEATTGVSYHPGHVWRILRQMGWSRSAARCRRRARRRGDRALGRRGNWPRVKKMPVAGTRGSASQDESGFSLLPSVRSTWAPKGKDPGAAAPFQLEAPVDVSGRRLRPDGVDAWLVFQMRPGSYKRRDADRVPRQLHDHLDGDKVTIIWDGLPSHRSRAMKAFIASQRSWLVVERLPATRTT